MKNKIYKKRYKVNMSKFNICKITLQKPVIIIISSMKMKDNIQNLLIYKINIKNYLKKIICLNNK